MEVDLSNSRKERIEFRKNDSPYNIASKFVAKHNLNPCNINVIVESIKQHQERSTCSNVFNNNVC